MEESQEDWEHFEHLILTWAKKAYKKQFVSTPSRL